MHRRASAYLILGVIMVNICRSTIGSLFLGIVALIVGAGIPACERSRPVQETATSSDNPFVVKHLFRTAIKEGWKCEAWLWASLISPSEPVAGAVRLTPEDKKTSRLPKVKVQLVIAHQGGKVAREADVAPTFLDCAKMKKRQESTYERRKGDKVESFPPPGPCWELAITDPFKSDGRLGGTPFEPDTYLLTLDVTIEGGPRFRFDNIPVTIESRNKGR